MDLGALLAQLKERFNPAEFGADANDPRNGETAEQLVAVARCLVASGMQLLASKTFFYCRRQW